MPDDDYHDYDEGEEAGECLVERCEFCGEYPENCRCEEG